MTDRAPIFAAIRAARGKGFSSIEVAQVDDLLDRLGIGREGQAAPRFEPRRINAAGLAIIKEFEGLRLRAYLCPAGVWTIGWGHTGPDVHSGLVISEAKAEALLRGDLDHFESAVRRLAPEATDNQFSAMVSFAFNVGADEDADAIVEGLGDSTLLRKHNAGDYADAAAQFAKWDKARVNGKLQSLDGLKRRRAAEAALYLRAA